MKKITALRLIAISIIIVLISGMLLSCGGNNTTANNNTANTTDANSSTDASGAGETTTARLEPNVPDSDFGGYAFTFLAHLYSGDDWVTDHPTEIVAQIDDSTDQEVETGDPINDAVYKRNATIEDKYNINIKMVTNADEKGAANKAVKAGDSVYDAILMFNNNVPPIITSDLLVDTSQLPYVDLTQP
ncbi:MAG: hypothetical protein FWD71_04020, partial [Oscillospiraceae bacterium]|nr:hypothetical protein [Oscillospiraceae bacterium]